MYCIGQFCRICIKNDGTLINLSQKDNDNITYLEKLLFCQPYLFCEKTSLMLYICTKCCIQLRTSYEFLKMCSKSKIILESYVYQLESITNNNFSTDLEELMENNYNEVKSMKIEPISDSICDKNHHEKTSSKNEITPIQNSSILNKLLVDNVKKKVPLDNTRFETYLQNISSLSETDRKVTKHGLEIIALYPTSTNNTVQNFNQIQIKDEPKIIVKAEIKKEIIYSDSSQFSEIERMEISDTINFDASETNDAFIDFLPVSVEIIESDTEIYNNNVFPNPPNNLIKLEQPNTNSKLPILKLKLNRQNKFQIVGKKIKCRVCPPKVNRKTVYRCSKCFVPICLSHALPFCQICIEEMPQEFHEVPRDVGKYPFFRVARSLKRVCGYCRPLRNRKSRSQCNDCAKHVCGEHKHYLCEFCAVGYSSPAY